MCDNPGLPDDVLDQVASLCDLDGCVRVVWLSRNFGQHPATVAGIVSTNGDWVVTMDEDGQHDPAFIRELLATAGRNRTPMVYAEPTTTRPHGPARNAASWVSGRVARSASGVPGRFHSFRLLEGSLARSACAYAGENVFLDVSLSWTCGTPSACPVPLREEGSASAFNFRRLLSHFWRMIVSSGTRPLRFIAAAGVVIALTGLLVGAWFDRRADPRRHPSARSSTTGVRPRRRSGFPDHTRVGSGHGDGGQPRSGHVIRDGRAAGGGGRPGPSGASGSRELLAVRVVGRGDLRRSRGWGDRGGDAARTDHAVRPREGRPGGDRGWARWGGGYANGVVPVHERLRASRWAVSAQRPGRGGGGLRPAPTTRTPLRQPGHQARLPVQRGCSAPRAR